MINMAPRSLKMPSEKKGVYDDYDPEYERPDYTQIITNIQRCSDPKKLEIFINNARRKKVDDVRRAAIRRLASLVPDVEPGTLEFDFWQSLHAYEIVLRGNKPQAVRLNASREKAETLGVVKTLSGWTLKNKHESVVKALIADGMTDLCGEAVIVKYKAQFSASCVKAAKARLIEFGG